jgi:hypothetical protein
LTIVVAVVELVVRVEMHILTETVAALVALVLASPRRRWLDQRRPL